MYVPILKNRTIEMSALKTLYSIPVSQQILPLLEIIQEKTRSNSNKTLTDELSEVFNITDSNPMFMVDILKINVPKSTNKTVSDFLTNVNRNTSFSLNIFKSLKDIKGIIPVVSYNSDNFINNTIVDDSLELRKIFSKIAYRIKSTSFDLSFPIIKELLSEGDYLILDIDTTRHTNPILKKMYKEINNLKNNIKFFSIIINSTKSDEIANVRLVDNEPIQEIDNSLRDVYDSKAYNFDGFGDYACLKNELPSTGGVISPGAIFYSKDNNFFVGYKGRKPLLSEFDDYIAPTIVSSEYWKEYSDSHHDNCPGCIMISNICSKKENGKNQGKWKGITILHYIYSIDEYLNEI